MLSAVTQVNRFSAESAKGHNGGKQAKELSSLFRDALNEAGIGTPEPAVVEHGMDTVIISSEALLKLRTAIPCTAA